MKKRVISGLVLIICMAMITGGFSPASEKTQEITPAQNAYGYYNQDFFTTFDSGIDGAYAEPVFGELITPEADTSYQYSPIQLAQMQILQETNDLAADVFAGEKEGEPGTAARRIYDLYDSLINIENDAEKEDAGFFSLISPLLQAEDPEAFREAADELYVSTGIHPLYNISVTQEASGTNRMLPMVSPAVLSFAEKIAFDPVSEEAYADAYRAALAEYADAIGLTLTDADLEEACRLQTSVLNPSENALLMEFRSSRYERASMEDTISILIPVWSVRSRSSGNCRWVPRSCARSKKPAFTRIRLLSRRRIWHCLRTYP